MGEANKRGSFETRKRLAIKKQEKEAKERAIKKLEIERNKTPEERKKEREDKLGFCRMVGNVLGISYNFPYYLR